MHAYVYLIAALAAGIVFCIGVMVGAVLARGPDAGDADPGGTP